MESNNNFVEYEPIYQVWGSKGFFKVKRDMIANGKIIISFCAIDENQKLINDKFVDIFMSVDEADAMATILTNGVIDNKIASKKAKQLSALQNIAKSYCSEKKWEYGMITDDRTAFLYKDAGSNAIKRMDFKAVNKEIYSYNNGKLAKDRKPLAPIYVEAGWTSKIGVTPTREDKNTNKTIKNATERWFEIGESTRDGYCFTAHCRYGTKDESPKSKTQPFKEYEKNNSLYKEPLQIFVPVSESDALILGCAIKNAIADFRMYGLVPKGAVPERHTPNNRTTVETPTYVEEPTETYENIPNNIPMPDDEDEQLYPLDNAVEMIQQTLAQSNQTTQPTQQTSQPTVEETGADDVRTLELKSTGKISFQKDANGVVYGLLPISFNGKVLKPMRIYKNLSQGNKVEVLFYKKIATNESVTFKCVCENHEEYILFKEVA